MLSGVSLGQMATLNLEKYMWFTNTSTFYPQNFFSKGSIIGRLRGRTTTFYSGLTYTKWIRHFLKN